MGEKVRGGLQSSLLAAWAGGAPVGAPLDPCWGPPRARWSQGWGSCGGTVLVPEATERAAYRVVLGGIRYLSILSP